MEEEERNVLWINRIYIEKEPLIEVSIVWLGDSILSIWDAAKTVILAVIVEVEVEKFESGVGVDPAGVYLGSTWVGTKNLNKMKKVVGQFLF